MAMAMAMAKKQEKNKFWRKQRHKGDCCCFGWAVYAPWACYMDIRTLYTTKPPKRALACLVDLAADPDGAKITREIRQANKRPYWQFGVV